MDNVSHTLVGAALGEAGLKRHTGLAMATLMVAANLPDLDILSIPFGSSIAFRRGWTHGPLALPVLPFLLGVVVVGFDRWQKRRGSRPPNRPEVRPRAVFALALVGMLTHPALDWLNNYGIRLLMPFSHEWFYGDAIFIVDPWIWLALGTGIWLSRRRARKGAARGTLPAYVAVIGVTLYIMLMIVGSRVGGRLAMAAAEDHGLVAVDEIMAGPVPLNPLRRELIYETDAAYHFGALEWMPRPVIKIETDSVLKNDRHSAVLLASELPVFRDFLYWSRFPLFEITERPGAYRVRAADARYLRRGLHWMTREVEVPRTGAVGRP